jgi:hypothetical protein
MEVLIYSEGCQNNGYKIQVEVRIQVTISKAEPKEHPSEVAKESVHKAVFPDESDY